LKVAAKGDGTAWATVAVGAAALGVGWLLAGPNFAGYRVHTFDLGLYARTAWDWSHGIHNAGDVQAAIPKSLERPALSTHFDLWLILLGPVVRLFGAQALLWAQLLAPLWGFWGLYRVGVQWSGGGWLGLGWVLCAATGFGLYHAWAFPYHSEVIGWSFLPWWWWALMQPGRRTGLRWLFLAGMLAAKEDMGLHMAFVAATVAWLHPPSANPHLRRDALWDAGIAGTYALLVLGWWMPAWAGGGAVSNIDHGPPAAWIDAWNSGSGSRILAATAELFRALFLHHGERPEGVMWKQEWWQALALSGAWLWLRRPGVFLMIVPLVAAKMWHDNPMVWGTLKHYNIALTWLVPLGVGLAWHPTLQGRQGPQLGMGLLLGLAVVGSAVATRGTIYDTRQWVDRASVDFLHPGHWKPAMSPEADAEWRRLLPPDAAVSASHHIVPHLIQQPVLRGFPDLRDAVYVVVYDFPKGDAPYTRQETMRRVSQLLSSGEWEQRAKTPGLYVLRRVNSQSTTGMSAAAHSPSTSRNR
jgi:hypothetical protein